MEQVRPIEGIWKCIVLGGEANADEKDIVHVRINAQIDEGPDKGRKVTYDEQVNNKSAKYVVQSARAVGWKGKMPIESTFRADVEAWIAATGGASTVEIQHVERKTGAKAGTFWAKARSIGRGPAPLKAPSQQSSADANEALMAAMASNEEGNGGGAPPADDVPPHGDDDIPFASCSFSHDRASAQIAKVLR